MIYSSEQYKLAQYLENAYRLFKRGLLPRDEYKLVIGAAARNIFLIANDMTRSIVVRQDEIQKIYRKVYCIAKSVEKDEGKGQFNWYLGYINFWRYYFSDCRINYTQSYLDLSDNPDFLLDYGRLEYNTGRLIQAEILFEQALNYRDAITFQPLQIYRWLAKTYRLSGKFDKQVSTLKKLQELTLAKSKTFDTDDLRISRELITNHLGQAYLSSGEYQSAFNFLASILNKRVDNSVELSKQAIQALIKMERNEEASYWANKWANEFKDKTILVTYLRLTQRIFSASKLRVKDIFSVSSYTDDTVVSNMYQHPYSRQVLIVERPQKMLIAYKAARQEFEEGFVDEGLEILFQAAEYGFDRSDALYIADLLAIIESFMDVISDSKKIDSLYAEAEQVFIDNPYIAVQCGHWHTSQGQHDKAHSSYMRANLLSKNKDKGLAVFLAVSYGNLGQHDMAQQLFKIILAEAKREDLLTVYQKALIWALSSKRYALALKWADDFMVYSTLGLGTHKESKPIYEYAGQIALASGNYKLATKYYEWAVISLAHWFSETQKNNSPLTLSTHAQVNLMWALSACLDGNLETSEMRLHQAKVLDKTNYLIPVIEAVIALQKRNFDGAISLLVNSHADDWLISLVGQYTLDFINKNNIDTEESRKLRFHVKRAQGELPNLLDLIKKVDEQEHSLQEIQCYVEESYRTYSTLKRAFQTLINNLPLTETEQSERDKLVRRIQSSDGDIEASVEAFVDVLIKRSKKDFEKNRYQLQLPAYVWANISISIKNRFEAAHSYIEAIEKGKYDLGPALLALSSAVECFLREILVNSLFKAIKKHNLKLLQDAPVKFKTVSLGQIPFMLGVKGNTNPNYKKFVHTWVSEMFSVEKASYILEILPERTEQIAIDRNNWAHGGESISTQKFDRFEMLLFDSNGIFVRLT